MDANTSDSGESQIVSNGNPSILDETGRSVNESDDGSSVTASNESSQMDELNTYVCDESQVSPQNVSGTYTVYKASCFLLCVTNFKTICSNIHHFRSV